jgi:L-ascorbate metabolism protein UlaG (beta-lactamase superfamily)
MIRWLLILIAVLVVLIVAVRFATPRLLDRIYYTGPVSDHFDGERFFNPPIADTPPQPAPQRRGGFGFMLRFMLGRDRAPWPERVPVTPAHPDAHVGAPCTAPCPDAPMRVTWIGHASALIQTQGLNILTDPIWTERASPFSFLGPKRVREPGMRFADLPKIDVVLVSHNHYDHLNLDTLERLWKRDRPLIVTALGSDTLLKDRGIPSQARDWGGSVVVKPGVEVIVERVQHWTSRWMYDRNRALWAGFTVKTPAGAIFFAGDTGWGDGSWAREAGERHGPYRFALIPIGAFQPRAMMRASHIGPEEAVDVFGLLRAQSALAIHWGTFQLSNEAIDEPRELLAKALAKHGLAADRFRATEAGEVWDLP